MKKTIVLSIAVSVSITSLVWAENVRGIDIEFVTIGNAGNAADIGGTPGCGAVGYNYRIGKYEITNAQWNTFTSAAGAPIGNPSEAYDNNSSYNGTQLPANYISWYEAAQFCNYLTSGDKSKGVYQFSGDNTNPDDFLGIYRDVAQSAYRMIYFLPTEDEWYKAAYYKPDGSGYSTYADGTNIQPIAGLQSNYNNVIGSPWDINNGMVEQNGTFNMMGNVWEWNETLLYNYRRGLRGGSFSSVDYDYNLASSWQAYNNPYNEHDVFGFRVVSIVPEPCTLLLLGLGGLLIRKR